MNEVFRDYVNKFILVYLDDVLIFSRSEEEHEQHVEMVLQRLRDEKLFAKLSKCEFNKSSVSILGHIVGANGLQMEERKVEAVVKWPRPTNKVEVQSFLGFSNYYRRFIKGFRTWQRRFLISPRRRSPLIESSRTKLHLMH
jgi:Reverse transcriptase (RNA-dependent DNA polymerase)